MNGIRVSWLSLGVSALVGKESRKNLSAFRAQHVWNDFRAVVEAWVGEQLEQRVRGAGLRIGRTIDYARHASQHYRARTHGAWLERNVQRASLESPVI